MKIYIASDHAGIELKKTLSDHLVLKDFDVEDLGPSSLESVDYPDFAMKLCTKVLEEENFVGILICGTGIGMSMTANRFNGIRAALCTNTTMARFSRIHNNSNVLCLGARIIGAEVAKDILDVYLSTGFEWGRHKKRIDKMDDLFENKQINDSLLDSGIHDDILGCAEELNKIKADYEDLVEQISNKKEDNE
jgi:ribose 5-phosphate isomerase B